MIDVGGIKFGIDLTGAVESRKEIKGLIDGLKHFNTSINEGKVTQKTWLAQMRATGSHAKDALRGVRDTAGGIKLLTARYDELTEKIKKAHIARKAYMADPKRWLKEHLELPPGAAAIQNKALMAQFAKIKGARQITAISGFGEFAREEKQISALNRVKEAAHKSALMWDKYYDRMEGKGRIKTKFAIFAQTERDLKKFNASIKEAHTHALHLNRVFDMKNMKKLHGEALSLNKVLGAEAKKMSALHGNALQMNKAFDITASKQRKVAAAMGRTTVRSKRQVTVWNRLTTAMQRNSSGYHTWWRRFGLIAVGFAVAYRAIRLFGSGVRLLTTTFTRGLTIMDDYTEGLAIISGMIALTWEGGANYVDRFNKSNAVLQGAMEQAIRLAPKYRLSMDEITAGFRELAQFGVIVDVGIAEKTLNTIAMIKEIAVVTGSTTRQIRQEIQALFMGQARVTDQFTKMIKTTMPELYAKVTDMSIVPQKKWELLIDSVFEFRYAIIKANQTIQGQWQVAQNTISVISMKALRTTGIYKEWVGHLQDFNEQLFNVDGTLGPLGKKLFVVFGDLWTSIKYAVLSLVDMGRVIADVYNITIKLLAPYKEWIKSIAKALVLMFAIRTVAGMIKSTFIAIAGATGITTLLISLKKLKWTLVAIALPVAGIAATIAAGLAVGYGLVGVIETVGVFWSGFIAAFKIDLELMANRLEIMKLQAQEFMWDRDHTKRINQLKAINKLLEFQQGIDFGDLWERAKDAAAKGQTEYLETLKSMATDVIGSFADLGIGAKDALADGLRELFGPDLIAELGSDFDALLDNLGKVLGDGKDNVFKDIKFTAADLFGMQPKAAVDELTRGMKTLADIISGELDTIWDDLFTGKIQKFTDLWDSIMNGLVNSFQKAMSDMMSIYMDEFLKEILGKRTMGGIIDAVGGGIIGSILGGFAGAPADPSSVGLSSAVGHGFTIPMANGGIIPEHVWGIGASGQRYEFGEKGPERVLSNADSFGDRSISNIYHIDARTQIENNKDLAATLQTEIEAVVLRVLREQS